MKEHSIRRIFRATLAVSAVLSLGLGVLANAETISIEAENFVAQGGTYNDGQPTRVSTYTVNGETALNYVNQGDYVEYDVSAQNGGAFNVEYQVGTAMTSGAEIQFLVQSGGTWLSQGQIAVPAGAWDNFQSLRPNHTVTLATGTTRIRILGAGGNAWQWNLESFVLRSVAAPGPTPTPTPTPQVTPTPSSEAESIFTEAESYSGQGGSYNDGQPTPVSVYTVNGVTALNYFNKDDYVDFVLDVVAESDYALSYSIGTSITSGAEVEFLVQEGATWTSQGKTTVAASHWDNFVTLNAAHSVHLPAGLVSVRILGSGSNAWQWNLDAFTLVPRIVGPTPTPTPDVATPTPTPTPDVATPTPTPTPDVATPTPTPTPDVATPTPPISGEPNPVSGSFVLEAEHYQAVSGDILVYAIDGGEAINSFQKGEYIEFYVDLDQSGLYEVEYRVATANSSGSQAGLFVSDHNGNLVLKNTTTISGAAGSWDVYYTQAGASQFNIFAGVNTLRIAAVGTEDYQFNTNYIRFNRISGPNLGVDGDGDGVPDIDDICANTPSAETANASGCSPSQLDGDADGINDAIDQCANTPANAFVDGQGCISFGGDDDDFDGVDNVHDQCNNTVYGQNVALDGCALSGNDADNDGVENAADECASTPFGEFANEQGCSSSQAGNVHTVNVSINANIRHSVNGVSNFGREKHMGVHSALYEQDWNGHHDKLNYLINTLDVYMGRDNGTATYNFQETVEDTNRDNWPDFDWMVSRGKTLREAYEANELIARFPDEKTQLIAGTNPHPTYPTLNWNVNGSTFTGWQPKDIETSAAWMGQYLEHYYAHSGNGYVGAKMPTYWEVINEPDMLYKTGAFMVTNQEQLWEYHRLVAQEIRAHLGSNAPMIGGMTWGLHDLTNPDGLSRLTDSSYDQWITATDPQVEAAAEEFFRNRMATSVDDTRTQNWYQWDVQWKGFMDTAGSEMDFYSVHIYDWPESLGWIRRAGHTQAMLDLVEWDDVNRHGFSGRKPLVISEYGAVDNTAWIALPHHERMDIENLKSFNAMLMAFLERPDYIIRSLPFTPIKPLWGYSPGGCGYDASVNCTAPYQYAMLFETQLNNGDWEWGSYIKFYELWANVDGTRVDSHSSDPDVQVDAYVDGNELFIILNNLENYDTSVNLNTHGLGNISVSNVEMRHLYFVGNEETLLARQHMSRMPSSITLAADATMVLRVKLATDVAINQQLNETKYFGESVSGGSVPHRVSINSGANTLHVNNVDVPNGPAEAMLRLTVNLFNAVDDTPNGFLTLTSLKINGVEVSTPIDWRGPAKINQARYFGTLEIPVPASVLQTNNTIDADFRHLGEIVVANLVVWDFSTTPQR